MQYPDAESPAVEVGRLTHLCEPVVASETGKERIPIGHSHGRNLPDVRGYDSRS